MTSGDGTPIAVWQSGEGPPLVAMDRRGRGQSGDADDYQLEREFEDVAAVVEWAGEAVDVIGHSHGGVCALEAALLTDGIHKLVLYEPPVGFLKTPADVVRQLQALLEAGRRDELLALFLREVAGLPSEQIELMRTLPAWQARLAAADTIPREERVNRDYVFDPDRFRALRTPTLFLLGGDSSDLFKTAAEAVDAALPDCRLVVMPGQRHAAIDTGTELFTSEVLGFLLY